MMHLNRSRCALSVCVAAVLLAGCGSGRPSQMLLAPSALTQPNAASSSTNPQSLSGKLLYVSNLGSKTVTVYSWRYLKQVGTLNGFEVNRGLCVNAAQDVFVTDQNAQKTYEYAHGGSAPIATFSAPKNDGPESCDVDPTSGNLAVANYGLYRNSASVTIFSSPGQYKFYIPPNIGSAIGWLAYDSNGNLFVDGSGAGSVVVLDELPSGGTGFNPITMNVALGAPGNIQWDGKYLAIDDLSANVIYQFTISGSNATEVGSTALGGTAGTVEQFRIMGGTTAHPQGTIVIGAVIFAASEVLEWKYPAGGTPFRSLTHGVSSPTGVTVSK